MTPFESDASITAAQAAATRLAQLEAFLREDPDNAALRLDAFEVALAAGQAEPALAHLRHAQRRASGDAVHAWRLREAQWCIACGRHDEARTLLDQLGRVCPMPDGLHEARVHDLALIDSREGHWADCIDRLAPLLADAARRPPAAAAALWLRALHHEGRFDEALAWARQAEATGRLEPAPAGVASLIAVDAADFARARRWSDFSISAPPDAAVPAEALVARATVALGERDGRLARRLADAAVRKQPRDGRALSTLAFAHLLAGRLADAEALFQKAVGAIPSHIGTWHGLAWTQLLLQQPQAAQGSFEQALLLDRNFADSHGGLAVAVLRQGRHDEAHAHAERALRLDAESGAGRFAAALLRGEVRSSDDLQRLAASVLAQGR